MPKRILGTYYLPILQNTHYLSPEAVGRLLTQLKGQLDTVSHYYEDVKDSVLHAVDSRFIDLSNLLSSKDFKLSQITLS